MRSRLDISENEGGFQEMQQRLEEEEKSKEHEVQPNILKKA